MNKWIELSIEFASQRNYLDELFKVYPTIPEGIREIDKGKWNNVENAFKNDDKEILIQSLLNLNLFPIKDSYVAYLRHDKTAIKRNPNTIDRLYGRLKELGLNEIWNRVSEPKETNRQLGPMFRNWLKKGVLGAPLLSLDEFESNDKNAILDASDNEKRDFAKKYLGYKRDKGLDFVARFNSKYVIGEAKFLTDFGGHQNAQFNDVISTLEDNAKAIKIAILDGVLYIKGKNKMYRNITKSYSEYNIMSILILRDFLYQI